MIVRAHGSNRGQRIFKFVTAAKLVPRVENFEVEDRTAGPVFE